MVLVDLTKMRLVMAINAWNKIDPRRMKKYFYFRRPQPWVGNPRALSPAQKQICNTLAQLSHQIKVQYGKVSPKVRADLISAAMKGIRSSLRRAKVEKPYKIPFADVQPIAVSLPAAPTAGGAGGAGEQGWREVPIE